MRIFFTAALCLVAVLRPAVYVAEAQEVRAEVELAEGGTLWTILAEHGCSEVELNNLWPLVAEDSGLDYADHQVWPAGTTFVVERNCDGSLIEGAGSAGSFAETLHKENGALALENEQLSGQVAALRAELGKIEEANASLEASIPVSVLLYILVALAIPLVGIVLYAHKLNRRISFLQYSNNELANKNFLLSKKEGESSPVLNDGDLVLPSTVQVLRGEVTHSFERKMEPRQQKIWYECPLCKVPVSSPKNCNSHMRSAHPLTRESAEAPSSEGVFPNLNSEFLSETGNTRTRMFGAR